MRYWGESKVLKKFSGSILSFVIVFFIYIIVAADNHSVSEIDYAYLTCSYNRLPLNKDIIWTLNYSGPDVADFSFSYDMIKASKGPRNLRYPNAL